MKKLALLSVLLIFNSVVIAQVDEINDPEKNFEHLWKVFEQRYANFELKQIDWQEAYKKVRPQINEKTTNRALFNICCSMLQSLNDGHVSIEANFKEEDLECGPPYEFSLDVEFNTEEKAQKFQASMASEFEKHGFSKPLGKKITEETNFQYRLSNSLAYLRLDEMTEVTTYGKFGRTLNRALAEMQEKEGLIIDLRFNGGGWDYIAYQLAKRFIPEGTSIGHYERTRIKGQDEYTPFKHRAFKAGGKNRFTKPIIILTSDYTASAAEVFLLLMRELPHVKIVGDSTEGIFSDMYEFKLPNKWLVSLSNQQYFSQDKKNFEGIGIPPDYQVLNKQADLDNQRDPVLQKAIDLLK